MHLHLKRHELKNSDIFMLKVIASILCYGGTAPWHWSCNIIILVIWQSKPIKNKWNFCRVTVSKSQKLSLQLILSSYHIPHYILLLIAQVRNYDYDALTITPAHWHKFSMLLWFLWSQNLKLVNSNWYFFLIDTYLCI